VCDSVILHCFAALICKWLTTQITLILKHWQVSWREKIRWTYVCSQEAATDCVHGNQNNSKATNMFFFFRATAGDQESKAVSSNLWQHWPNWHRSGVSHGTTRPWDVSTSCHDFVETLHATHPAYLILLNVITLIITGEEQKSCSSSCNFLHHPVTSVRSQFSNTLSQCSSLQMRDQVSYSYKTTL
jgi:hypothetical protein